jgi:hypothetical protein
VRQFPQRNWAPQLAVIVLISCISAAAGGQDEAPVGAVSLQPFSGKESTAIPSPFQREMSFDELLLPPASSEPIPYFPDLRGSQDFGTISQFIDSPEYVGVDVMAPIPETSTWVAALLAGLVTLGSLHKKLRTAILRISRFPSYERATNQKGDLRLRKLRSQASTNEHRTPLVWGM